MTLSMAGYVTNDAFIKLAAEELPLFQSIFLRGVWVTLVLVVLNISQGTLSEIGDHFSRPMIVRLACETLGTIAYLSALTRLPLAEMTAVLQLVPVVVVFAAARLLREPVSLQRIAAVSLGFVGVLLIVKPGSASFSPWYGLGLLTVAFIVTRELATRRIGVAVPTQVVALLTAISITLMGVTISIFEGWEPLRVGPVLLLVAAGTFITVGYLASVATVRVGDLSFSAPFRYSIIVFSIILQIVVFGEVPDVLTFVGSAVVAIAGLWAFWSDPGQQAAVVGPLGGHATEDAEQIQRVRQSD